MHERGGNHGWLRGGVRLDERLDKMLAAGRLTDEEAQRLRSATTADGREEVARAIQLRHARARIDEAVENGSVAEAETTALVERLESGEDLRFLRGIGRRRGKA